MASPRRAHETDMTQPVGKEKLTCVSCLTGLMTILFPTNKKDLMAFVSCKNFLCPRYKLLTLPSEITLDYSEEENAPT